MRRFLAPPATIAALALINLAVPQSIVLEVLSAGLASLGLGLLWQGRA